VAHSNLFPSVSINAIYLISRIDIPFMLILPWPARGLLDKISGNNEL
jgi:hypothetical protein